MLQAKKSLGQHFLKDENIAGKIVDAFMLKFSGGAVLEIGPGTGVLTKYLADEEKDLEFYAVEADERMVRLLTNSYPRLEHRIFHEDVLQFDFAKIKNNIISIIGNFPYNISSQILFSILKQKELVPLMVGMFQKEVAKRITSQSGNKEYGILSVLLQAFYDAEYLFEVHERSFVPAPKVKSGVIRLIKKKQAPDLLNEDQFFRLVKTGFQQRRKMLRNSLSEWPLNSYKGNGNIFQKRPEQLSVDEWIELSNCLEKL